jgi:hypothetical protein
VKPNLTKRLESLEASADLGPRTHWIWRDEGQDDDLSDEIAVMLAAGRARPGDRFCTIAWLD